MNRPLLTRSDLRTEQREAVRLTTDLPSFLLVAPMGSGKTGAFLTAALDLLDTFEVRRVLIVAPLRVATSVWPLEAKSWEHTRFMSVAVVAGPKEKERAAAVAKNAEVTVCNFENLVWLYNHVGGVRGWPYDCVIVDESSMFKAGKKRTKTTKRRAVKVEPTEIRYGSPVPTKEGWSLLTGRRGEGGDAVEFDLTPDGPVFRGTGGREVLHLAWQKVSVTQGGKQTRFGVLCEARRKIKRLYELTGTPGDEHDMWGQIYLIDQGARLGSTMTAFEKRWFDYNAYNHVKTPKEGAKAEIMSRISDVVISLPPPADLPEPTFTPVRVHMPAAAVAEYARFKRELYSQPHDVSAVSAGVLAMKLMQFANGSAYREDKSIAHIHDAKIEALEDLITRAAGDPMLVLYSFKFDLARIRKLYPQAVVLNEDPNFERRWNDGKIKVGVAHPKSCAHGLNLQFGGHLGVWYGFTWSLELYRQANARLARPGQKWPVCMYQIIADQTDDDRLLSVLDSQGASQDDMTRMVLRDVRQTC